MISYRISPGACFASAISTDKNFSLISVKLLVKRYISLDLRNQRIFPRMPRFAGSFNQLKRLNLKLSVHRLVAHVVRTGLGDFRVTSGKLEVLRLESSCHRDVTLRFAVAVLAGLLKFNQLASRLIQVNGGNDLLFFNVESQIVL